MKFTMQEDLEYIANVNFIPWEQFKGKTILITGATGLIGYNLVCSLLYTNNSKNLGIHILALVRNDDKAKERFWEWNQYFENVLAFIVGSVEQLPYINTHIDFIIHGASQTRSRTFVEQPAETIKTALIGTINLLEFARSNNVDGFIYLSSMEVYGCPPKGHKVTESDIGRFSPMESRNSYPLSKVQCENLCSAYAKEYGVNTKIIRLTQTFGPEAKHSDERVFAYFGRCVAEKSDIVLKTRGESEHSYLYTCDAVTAVLTILLKGVNGEVYNAANEATYSSISQMANAIAEEAGIHVCYDLMLVENNGYPGNLYIDLDTSKLQQLGWSIKKQNNIKRMVAYWNSHGNKI